MAKAVSTITQRIVRDVSDLLDAQRADLAGLVLSSGYPEDLAALDVEVLAASIRHAHGAHAARDGANSIVRIARHSDDEGRNHGFITLLNRNRPFLFDSVLGELNAEGVRIDFVVHPVFEREGVNAASGVKTSLIHVITGPLREETVRLLEHRLSHVVDMVCRATGDWKAMLARLDVALDALRDGQTPATGADLAEAIAFIEWLRDDNFTFLGMREYDYRGGQERGKLERSDKPGLGILSDPDLRVLKRGDEPVTTTPQIRSFLNSGDLLIVTKANAKSVVHRRAYLDYIGIKTYDAKGKLNGELRIVGLFTSTAYTRSVLRVPFIRSKAQAVVERSAYEADSHSGKALLNVLESFPRDELFQVDVPHLSRAADAILALSERPRVRVIPRIDPFDRFVSVLVYVPRERYDTRTRVAIGEFLANAYEGHVSAFYPAFPEGALTRVHFIIGRAGGKTPEPSTGELEDGVRAIIRTWDDGVRALMASHGGDLVRAFERFAFPEAYRETQSAARTVTDLGFLEALTDDRPIAVDFYRPDGAGENEAALRIFHLANPVPLSRRVPLLENMGMRVISETTQSIHAVDGDGKDAGTIWLHDMQLESRSGAEITLEDGGGRFEDAFLSVWSGRTDSDPYNGLILAAGLDVEQAGVLRAYGRYLKQASVRYSQLYMATTLIRHPQFARHLYALFDARLNPARAGDPDDDTEVEAKHLNAGIRDMLASVQSLDEDRMLNSFAKAINATLRTNHFMARDSGGPGDRPIVFKFDPQMLDFLPAPRPYREMFVYGTEVEGVHLRFGPIARGGLRWSDRAEDYRTEVLGLVKAQQTKNAVIVPVGAKGGFYPKMLPADGDRQAVFEAGKAAYVTFISALLSITDNLDGDAVVPPRDVVRHDGDDPYFVVAADKGTATFSDTANAISQTHGFWLDDAFASGGSAGYDHKAMGITARGAWEAVKRHFREMDKDIRSEPFTVVGVGDMSGDVFGNGMLLSEQIRLIAAFDHRDIFIDPDPDPATSFKERKRLFEMGRSTWQDYDSTLISRGGGVYSRQQKSISLSKAAASAIGLDKTAATPDEIMRAILSCEAELMWFGGIGTYVRATSENDAEVGDRANDAIRITARDLRVKVIGEGANLGATQRARIEFGLNGGRCNSDAIDNSGGVNSSDVEVNIKIALASAMKDGSLTREKRNTLLEAMTDSVAELVLDNNYEQTLTLSRLDHAGPQHLALQGQVMDRLETQGHLNRAVEMLPDAEQLAEREKRGQGLTRSEAGVLLAYAKIVLFDDLVASGLPDDPWLEGTLMGYFPPRLRKAHGAHISSHRLRREIIATQLANEVVNRGGPGVITRYEDATGVLPSQIVEAHIVTREAYGIEAMIEAVHALDNVISGAAQLDLYADIATYQRISIGNYLKSGATGGAGGLAAGIERLKTAADAFSAVMKKALPDYLRQWLECRVDDFKAGGLSSAMAGRIAALPLLSVTPNMLAVSEETGRSVEEAAHAYYAVTKTFKIGRLERLAHNLDVRDYYDGLAQARALDVIQNANMSLCIVAIGEAMGKGDADRVQDAVGAWCETHAERIGRVQARVAAIIEGGDLTVSRLTVAAGLLADLVNG